MTTTYTDTTDFTALAHCSVESGSVIPGKYNFSADATGTGKDDWTDGNTSNGTMSIVSGKLRAATNTNNSAWDAITGPYSKLTGCVSGDFTLEFFIDISGASATQYAGGQLDFVVDTNNRVGLRLIDYQGATGKTIDIYKKVSGSSTTEYSETDIGSDTAYIKIQRTGNSWAYSYKLTAGASWTLMVTSTAAIGSAPDLLLGANNSSSGTAIYAEFDDITFTDGFGLTAKALIHDASQTYMDAGADQNWDNSTAAETTTGSPTVTYNYADYTSDQSWTAAQADSNASWSSNLTEAQLQAVTDTEKRCRYFRANITGDSGDTLDAFAIDAVTPSSYTPAGNAAGGLQTLQGGLQ